MSERWVDVSHEALIRGWPRLRGWIEEDRAGLRLHRRLTEAAEEWHKAAEKFESKRFCSDKGTIRSVRE